MNVRTIAAAALFGLLLPTAALARHTTSDDGAMDKLGRGFAGMTTGFLELPGNIAAESRDRGPLAGMTVGFAKGIGMIPVRTLVGVYEFVTAPIPAPDDYAPILEPEYPWDYFEGASSARTSYSAR
jgi:putative exosortase-associated protein (TIGR04073 family)